MTRWVRNEVQTRALNMRIQLAYAQIEQRQLLHAQTRTDCDCFACSLSQNVTKVPLSGTDSSGRIDI